MIGVLVPAHDEEALIGDCLRAIRAATRCPALRGEAVQVVVALDGCSDGTAAICADMGVGVVELQARSVGRARAAAADWLLARGARWLASTDADSRVPAHWLSAQLATGADAFCGTVRVGDWLDYGEQVRRAFLAGERHADGHAHVHGANLGVSARAYAAVGGFPPLPAHEDHALVEGLARAGYAIARRDQPCVTTSARRDCRARHGFGDYLRRIELDIQGGMGAAPDAVAA